MERCSGRQKNKGVSVELCQISCGFELLVPEREIETTDAPSSEILQILRNEVDPFMFDND